MDFDGVRIDGALWIFERGLWQALCPNHHIRLSLDSNDFDRCYMSCGEGEKFVFKREYNNQMQFVQDKVDAKNFRKLKYINIDGEYTPIAESKAKSEDGNFFVKAILTDSKIGLRMVVYAGEKGKEKTQIFVEPDIERLAFDQTNNHPSEVFLKLEGVFDSGKSVQMQKKRTIDD